MSKIDEREKRAHLILQKVGDLLDEIVEITRDDEPDLTLHEAIVIMQQAMITVHSLRHSHLNN